MKKITFALLSVGAVLAQQNAYATYSEGSSSPITITLIYAKEYGSPFVYVSGGLNTACLHDGVYGLYLYGITQAQPNWNYRNNKMAMLLKAQATGTRITVDYFYDPSVSGWAACYIEGIQLIE
jgi:hypothetical protein